MEATQITAPVAPCDDPLPELEVPMINTIVSCLAREHRRLDELNMRLAFAATRLVSDPETTVAMESAIQAWDEIRRSLWPHLQIEDELVLSWGRTHEVIAEASSEALRGEHQRLRELVAALPTASGVEDLEASAVKDRAGFAQTLLALARLLDSHIERYESDVLPAVRRALFRE